MFKLLGCILKFFLSIFLFFAIGISSTFVIPFFTAGRYEANETPDGYFIVLVEINDSENNQTFVHDVSWNEYSENIYDYKPYLSPSEGNCDNAPFECTATNIDPGKQLIELWDRQENYWLYNKYYVTNEKITPLYSRIMSPGDSMLGFFISFIVTPIVLICISFYRKRFNNIKAKSNSVIAVDS
jgi:hypothetical protein